MLLRVPRRNIILRGLSLARIFPSLSREASQSSTTTLVSVSSRAFNMAARRDTDRSRQLIKRFPAYCRGLLVYAPWATLFTDTCTRRMDPPAVDEPRHRYTMYRVCGTHRPARVFNGRVLIGPGPSLGTSGCPRVEFPPRRLLRLFHSCLPLLQITTRVVFSSGPPGL